MKSKRGISETITIILFVLIAIAAVAVVWAALSGMFKGNVEDIGAQANCLDSKLSITQAKNISNILVDVTVERGADTLGISLKAYTIGVFDSNGTSKGTLDVTTVPTALSSLKSQVTVTTLAGSSTLHTVKVAPKIGNTQCEYLTSTTFMS